jgi:hypothetical protein
VYSARHEYQAAADVIEVYLKQALVTRATLARFIAFHQAAEGDPTDIREFLSQGLVFGWQVFFERSH